MSNDGDIPVNDHYVSVGDVNVSVGDDNEATNYEIMGYPVTADIQNELKTDANLKDLKNKRRYSRMKLSRLYNVIKDTREENFDRSKLKGYLDKLLAIKKELNSMDPDIYACIIGITDDENSEPCKTEELSIDEYEMKLEFSISKLEGILKPSRTGNINNNDLFDRNPADTSFLGPQTNKLKLPQISLPVYSNSKTDNLEKFLYSFESIVDKHQLSPYEKFVYLKGQLQGAPLTLVDSLGSYEQSYDMAVELLTEAFASKITQKYDTIRQLSKLRLTNNGDPYTYVGEMKSLKSSVENLNITVKDVFQYFVWSGFNDKFQSILIHMTNESKPDLDQITKNVFDAIDRYVKIGEKPNDSGVKYNSPPGGNRVASRWTNSTPIDSTSMAVNVNRVRFIPCHLCVSDNLMNVAHMLKDCTKYVSAHAKVHKLEQLGYCSKCSFKNHSTKDCKFRFTSSCYHCKGQHMSYLCKKYNGGKSQITENRTACIQSMQANSYDDVLMETYTTRIINGDKQISVRTLKDSGSQRNFIEESVANKLSFPTVNNNLKLRVKGILGKGFIKTRSVNVNMDFGYSVCTIEAVVVPVIDIELHVPGVDKLASEFVKRGYELADPGLLHCSNIVGGYEMVLGARSQSLLRATGVYFGPDYCGYLNSPLGVILYGDMETLLANIDYIPNKDNRKTSALMSAAKSGDSSDPICDSHSLPESCNVFTTMVEMWKEDGEINCSKLGSVTDEALDEEAERFLNYDIMAEQEDSEVNQKLINYVISNTSRLDNGRLVMPLTWNWEIKHLLGTNYNLSKSILQSNFKKLSRYEEKLIMYDNVFRDQEQMGIIEKIENVQEFMKTHPEASFLPHMGVFKLDRETSKCRVVFLSNLCERNSLQPNALSHNQTLQAGPCLNHKLSTAVILSRFDRYMLSFDVEKAFLGISLRESDQNKLCFLWYNSIEKGDYRIIAYRNLRLSFGLRPSPAILMLGLYQMLMLNIDTDTDDIIDLKRRVYNAIYMDNGAVSSDDGEYIKWAHNALIKIFGEYQFNLQQFNTNFMPVQNKLNPCDDKSRSDAVKYFGMQWHISSDKLSPNAPALSLEANTKRTILSSLNSVYDPFNLYNPILNRAKLYFQKLQVDKNLEWDTTLSSEYQREWINIVRQVNTTPSVSIDRFVGSRDSVYDLIAFTDASTSIYGVVIYIKEIVSNRVNFLLAKSKLINSKNSVKTVPSLECQALCYGTEVLMDLYTELTGTNVVIPVKIRNLEVYSDSMVNIHWLASYFQNFDKMQKRSVFVMNRLESIKNLCSVHPVVYSHIQGKENPADYTTRAVSYNKLSQTCYYSGPAFLKDDSYVNDIQIIVPHPLSESADESTGGEQIAFSATVVTNPVQVQHLFPLDTFSCLYKTIRVYRYILLFIKKCKIKVERNKGSSLGNSSFASDNLYQRATNTIISTEQKLFYSDVFYFFSCRKKLYKDVPNLIVQMNLVIDDNSIIRVKGKFSRGKFPILLHYDSVLTKMIVQSSHRNMCHSGLYSILRELRKSFWIQRGFTTVRKILKDCITCRRVNERPIKVNENSYREFRNNPPEIPFSYVFVDHAGPWKIRLDNKVVKVYILVITCLWSRAIDLKICYSLDVSEFLRAIQVHIYEFGLFQLCLSDLGSQITSGARIISEFIDEPDVQDFFDRHNVKSCTFEHYPKGNSSLGSLVEVCVKQTKRLIGKSIKNNVLDFKDFQLLVSKVTHMINRRPVGFKESLREYDSRQEIPDCITPEKLLRGYELLSLDVIPQMRTFDDSSTDEFSPDFVIDQYSKFRKVHSNLVKIYHEEFLVQLLSQAIGERDKYKPVLHKTLDIGDIVLLVEAQTKQINYPMGIVKHVEYNKLGEVVSAIVFKGRTREKVFRHSTSLILLLKSEGFQNNRSDSFDSPENHVVSPTADCIRPRRNAACRSQSATRSLIKEGLI